MHGMWMDQSESWATNHLGFEKYVTLLLTYGIQVGTCQLLIASCQLLIANLQLLVANLQLYTVNVKYANICNTFIYMYLHTY
jgi:hypothetical protein